MAPPDLVLPNFLIVGASRSGTTSLHHYLSEHDDIFMPAAKELRFFDSDRRYRLGIESYGTDFAGWAGQVAIGEASPPYFFQGITFDEGGRQRYDPRDDAPARIARDLPDVKIVISLRNPVDRAYSQFWKNRAEGREPVASFRAALNDELAGNRPPDVSPACWIFKNSYSIHLTRWLSLIPSSRVSMWIFEEWVEDPARMLVGLAEFLGVGSEGMPSIFPVLNTGSVKGRSFVKKVESRLKRSAVGRLVPRSSLGQRYPELDLDTRAYATEVFADEIEKTEQIVGRELDIWRR